ncbi:hypothetical protein EI94DRAFT_1725468 [Lactarius quietus]|nr:hypothetical protein EI94DRAFT_1725468 [Lactarius quietus]
MIILCPLGMYTFTPLLHTLIIPYMRSSSQSPASRVMQRSQSTPNVGVRPAGCEDPFGLAGFFPPRPRSSDQEQSNWWRDESPEDDSEQSKEKTNYDGSALGFQRVLFSRTIIEHEDKLGVLSILTGKWPNWEDETTEDHLHSPYTSDVTCDDEAVRLAYERRRSSGHGQQWDSDGVFYGREEEAEAAGSSLFGL